MTPNTYHILKVVSLCETPEGLLVSFSDGGTALLGGEAPEGKTIIRRLRLAQQSLSPVGVSVDLEGRICDVAGADHDTVLGVEDNGSMPAAVAVWFGKLDGLTALLKEHPKFREIMTALTEATASNQAVWYITRSGCLLDVIQSTPQEDSALNSSSGG